MDQHQIDFIKSICNIGTSKFTTVTYKENCEFKKKWKKENNIMITRMNSINSVPIDAGIFILEMNNNTNEIEGIGIIKNMPTRCEDIGLKIYDNDYYNSYFYHGPYHISRKKILEKDENKKPLAYLENLIFKGSKHLKRGGNAGCFSLTNNRIETSLPYSDFVYESDEWIWMNKPKAIRRCSKCFRKKDDKHRELVQKKNGNDSNVCTLKRISRSKRCNDCGEIKLAHPWRDPHICSKIKKYPEHIRIIYTFLRNLFIY